MTQPYIDLGWYTVPLTGSLEREADGSKTIPNFPKGWRTRYTAERNTQATPLGGVITGAPSNIVAIDCDNEQTWALFRSLDPDYEHILLSRGKGYLAGTLVYTYDEDLATTFSLHNGEFDLDFYSDKGFIYLATAANKTKVPLTTPLPEVREMPLSVKMLLRQLAKKQERPDDRQERSSSLLCLAPMLTYFVGAGVFTPGVFRIITPKAFRTLPQYVDTGYLHPQDIPSGRGSEYLSKVSAILGADVSVSKDLYVHVMSLINSLFAEPMLSARLDKTILDPMLSGNANIGGVSIWQYDENWEAQRLILTSKRQLPTELAFDDFRNIYYAVDSTSAKYRAFHRDGDMMSFVEASTIAPPKKGVLKQMLPVMTTCSNPALEFGFHADPNDPTARLLNTFNATPELMIFNNPETYADRYKHPETTLRYLESLVPDPAMRPYLLSFVKTKLTNFSYSPVILYFMGAQGSGKDIFVGLLETIIGKVSRPTTKEFTEMFNGWLLDTYFVQLDEYGNQLTSAREREEVLGKIKAYTGKKKVQIRQMRSDGFQYEHNATFIMTSNKNPLMLEDGDRRIALFQTPNVLSEQAWVSDIDDTYTAIQDELKDFCYYLATEVKILKGSEYLIPPESANKRELIADSMYPGDRICYAIKQGMQEYLTKLAQVYGLKKLANGIRRGQLLLGALDELYDELTEYNGDVKNFHKALRIAGYTLNGPNSRIKMRGDNPFAGNPSSDNPFTEEEEDE